MQKLKGVQNGRGRERLSWRRWRLHRQQKKSEGGSCGGDLMIGEVSSCKYTCISEFYKEDEKLTSSGWQ